MISLEKAIKAVPLFWFAHATIQVSEPISHI